jgi:hypothetical protein
LPDARSKSTAELESRERECHADAGDDGNAKNGVHVVGAECEADDEIVDAEQRAGEDELSEASPSVGASYSADSFVIADTTSSPPVRRITTVDITAP